MFHNVYIGMSLTIIVATRSCNERSIELDSSKDLVHLCQCTHYLVFLRTVVLPQQSVWFLHQSRLGSFGLVKVYNSTQNTIENDAYLEMIPQQSIVVMIERFPITHEQTYLTLFFVEGFFINLSTGTVRDMHPALHSSTNQLSVPNIDIVHTSCWVN